MNIKQIPRKNHVLCIFFYIICFRTLILEIYVVDSPSMTPTIQPTEVYYVDKLSGGAIMPRRFAEIPIINVFTWIKPLREMDERNDWGLHRFPGYRSFRERDIILFHAKDNYKTVLVKRIAYTVHEKGNTYYYVYSSYSSSSHSSSSGSSSSSVNYSGGRANKHCPTWNIQYVTETGLIPKITIINKTEPTANRSGC